MVMKHLHTAGLAAVLLILFFVPSSSAQTPASIEGEWVGNSEPPGRSEFVRLSLTEDAGELRFPLARATLKLSLVRREGSQVRFELSSLKLVMTGTITGDEIDGEAEVPGTTAHFHLTRIRKVAPEILTSYVGVYRFRNGEYFVIDRFDYIPDILHVIDVKSGEVRAIFPRSETQFIGGPALYVATPTRLTINFSGAVRGSSPIWSSRNRFGSEGSAVGSRRDANSHPTGRSHFQKR